MKFHFKTLAAASLLALTACATTPYQAPRLDEQTVSSLPSTAEHASDGLAGQASAPPSTWWAEFGDPQLDALVRLAWQGNYDVQLASVRLQAAQHLAGVADAAKLPAAAQDISAGRNRLAATESRSGVPASVNPVQLTASLSWELDLFGRLRSGAEAAHASVDEREALRDDVRRLVLARVVEAYLELRSAQQLAATLHEQLLNQESTLKLVQAKEAAGSASRADCVRYKTQLSLLRSRLPVFVAQERAARNRLATLTGQRLDAPVLLALDKALEFRLPPSLVTDEPVALLQRRPDVRAAERSLKLASARQGMASADLYPRISLSALLGNVGVAGDWLSGDAQRWRVGAAVSWPLFDGGATKARVKAAGSEVLAARANFDKAVAMALEDVDTAVSNWTQLHRRNDELVLAQGFAEASVKLARTRYKEGAESLLGVLDAERVSLAAQEQLVLTKRDLALATARSYTALAGGFDLTQTR
jgi:NodT family efflux transporter outer membrane factor (OMF) lipoprotein